MKKLIAASCTLVGIITVPYFGCDSDFNTFQSAVKNIPHPEKVHKGGEDAYFLHPNILAVADGVGGWNSSGVDPAIYSKNLVKIIGELVQKDLVKYILNPKQLIIDAERKNKEMGSSTLVVASIDKKKSILRASYIGDSSYLILKKKNDKYEAFFQSQEQQKKFNFPYQIGSYGDDPSESISAEHIIENDDIVIIGSDGLFDNLTTQQILNIVKRHQNHDIQTIADSIGIECYRFSLNSQIDSPFAIKAKQNGKRFSGGKSDDITVIIAKCIVKN